MPQVGHTVPAAVVAGAGAAAGGASGLPHPVQNRASVAFCEPQLEQAAISPPSRNDIELYPG